MFQPDKLADLIAKPAPARDPSTLEALIAWLEPQDGAKEYEYYCASTCLFAQYREYVRACGGFQEVMCLDMIFGRDAYDKIAQEKPWTVSGALTRARAYARAAHNEVR